MTNKTLDLKADNLIECLIRREGGTIVDFGFHNRKKAIYVFRPINSADPESPHVCNVPDDDHFDRFLDIPEAYRIFDPDEDYEPVMSLASPTSDTDPFDPRNDFRDLLSVNPEEVSNEWLGRFTQEILNTSIRKKQELSDMAVTNYKLEFDYSTTTATEIARMILVARIEEEKNASDLGE